MLSRSVFRIGMASTFPMCIRELEDWSARSCPDQASDPEFDYPSRCQCRGESPAPRQSLLYGKVDFCIEGFVVPLSILYAGFKQFISNNEASMFPATQDALVKQFDPLSLVLSG